jgi:hypothetical protein
MASDRPFVMNRRRFVASLAGMSAAVPLLGGARYRSRCRTLHGSRFGRRAKFTGLRRRAHHRGSRARST